MNERLETNWIPVSKKTPENEYDLVLVTIRHKKTKRIEVTFCIYRDNNWWGFEEGLHISEWEVIAWKPLPRPYTV